MAARLGEHYGIADLRDAGRLQVHRPEDDRDRRDDGRRGVRRLRLRDAPAGARRHLRRPAAARPVPAREGGRPLAGVEGDRPLPRDRRPVVLPADRRPRRASGLPRDRSAGCSSTSRRRRPTELAGQPVARTQSRSTRSDGFKFFVADGSWLLDPDVAAPSRSCASTRRRPRAEARDAMLGAGEQLVRGCVSDATSAAPAGARRVDKPWGHELIWAHTDRYVGKLLVIETGKRLSLQYHEVKDESILVLSGRLRLYLEDDAGDRPRPGARPGRGTGTSRPAASIATRRSSAASSSRSRPRSSTTSSASRTTSAARGPTRPDRPPGTSGHFGGDRAGPRV